MYISREFGPGSFPKSLGPLKSEVLRPSEQEEVVDSWKLLNFEILKQPDQSSWCWAAVTASITRYYEGTSICQCEVANIALGEKICCQNTDPKDCNKITSIPGTCDQPLGLEIALSKLNHFDHCIEKTPQLPGVQVEIDNARVVAFRQKAAHFVVLDGYQVGGVSVRVRDPADGLAIYPIYTLFSCCCTHTYFTK